VATEADVTLQPGAYVHRLTRGYKRWFFNLSLPHDYLDWLASSDRVAREPDLVAQDIARAIDAMWKATGGGKTNAP
jgi:hypothetical protein